MISSVMGLLDLPNELLWEIIQLFKYGWDLTAFGIVNRRLHGIVNTYLYQKILPNCSRAVLEWIVEKGNDNALAQCLKADILVRVNRPVTTRALRGAIFLDTFKYSNI